MHKLYGDLMWLGSCGGVGILQFFDSNTQVIWGRSQLANNKSQNPHLQPLPPPPSSRGFDREVRALRGVDNLITLVLSLMFLPFSNAFQITYYFLSSFSWLFLLPVFFHAILFCVFLYFSFPFFTYKAFP